MTHVLQPYMQSSAPGLKENSFWQQARGLEYVFFCVDDKLFLLLMMAGSLLSLLPILVKDLRARGLLFSLLTSERVAKQFPVMTEAISQIRAKGLQTAVLSNNFYLPNGKSFLLLDWKQFDVVS